MLSGLQDPAPQTCLKRYSTAMTEFIKANAKPLDNINGPWLGKMTQFSILDESDVHAEKEARKQYNCLISRSGFTPPSMRTLSLKKGRVRLAYLLAEGAGKEENGESILDAGMNQHKWDESVHHACFLLEGCYEYLMHPDLQCNEELREALMEKRWKELRAITIRGDGAAAGGCVCVVWRVEGVLECNNFVWASAESAESIVVPSIFCHIRVSEGHGYVSLRRVSRGTVALVSFQGLNIKWWKIHSWFEICYIHSEMLCLSYAAYVPSGSEFDYSALLDSTTRIQMNQTANFCIPTDNPGQLDCGAQLTKITASTARKTFYHALYSEANVEMYCRSATALMDQRS
ncbi:hypothetical protein BDQ17DRAFT_1409314, partial [Cyathus striatus]